jgi:hypothetical protein
MHSTWAKLFFSWQLGFPVSEVRALESQMVRFYDKVLGPIELQTPRIEALTSKKECGR